MPADHCPPSGQRTERVRNLDRILDPVPSAEVPSGVWVAALREARDTLRHLRALRLCPDCGYPLDGAHPYPRRGA